MKPENKFRKWFLDKFQAQMNQSYPGTPVTVQKHADYATDGIADIDLSINGMTMWLEVKLLTSCQAERKLHVTPLQRAYLEGRAKGGVPTGLLVGLSLGPRKGYLVALFVPPISEVVHRDMFRQPHEVITRIYSMAHAATLTASRRFESVSKLPQIVVPKGVQTYGVSPVDFAHLDAVDLRDSERGADEPTEDGA